MPFIINKPVSGKDNVGRRSEVTILSNLLSQGENVVIYDIPRSGKSSLIQQTFYNMRVASMSFSLVEFSCLNCRTVTDLVIRFGSAVLKTVCSTPADYLSATGRYLEGTHLVFDHNQFVSCGQVLSLNWDIDDNDVRAVFTLPYRIALDKFQKMFVVMDDFQNVMLTEDGSRVCRILSDVFENPDPVWTEWCCYILCGNQVNAMKEIFEHNHLLFKHINRLELSRIDKRDMSDYLTRKFLETGKEIYREQIAGILNLFDDNPGYVIHFSYLCDFIAKGYVLDSNLNEALEIMIAIYGSLFKARMNDLTTFQVNFLRAVMDGHRKFGSVEVIRRYSLNSAANVKRLKEALCKKEIITLNAQDEPEILDPLFKYWLGKYFFDNQE